MSINEIVDQPVNNRIDEIHQSFESEFRMDAFDPKNYGEIFGNSVSRESYLDGLTVDVTEESERAIVAEQMGNSMIHRTLRASSALRSNEGWTHETAPGSNEGALDHFTPATILGYNAKSHMLSIFKSMTGDKNTARGKKEIQFRFENAYVIKSDAKSKSEKIGMPEAIRSGKLAGLLNPDYVTLTPDVTLADGQDGGASHVTMRGGVGFSDLGVMGNALEETGKNPSGWALAEDIRVDKIVYDKQNDPTLGGTPELVELTVQARATQPTFSGDVDSARFIDVKVELTLADKTTVTDFFTVHIDRDSGDYRVANCMTNRVKSFSFFAPILNPTNQGPTLKHGRDAFSHRLVASPRETMSMGLAMDNVMDEFDAVEAGFNDIVKYASNEFANVLAHVNDTDMENLMIGKIDDCIDNPALLNQFIATPKLGGFAAKGTINVADRPSGGENPMAYLEYGIKDTLSTLTTDAESDTYFSEASEREWVFYGYKNDIRRFTQTRYVVTEGKVEENGDRYGYKKKDVLGYTDSFGDRVRFIGSTDSRAKDLKGKVYGMLRSNSPKVQPTAVYYGHSFKILKTRETSADQNIDSISFWTHDVYDILSLSGIRVDLTNNDVDTYNKVVTSARTHIVQ